jgi:hypothetical protein
MKTISLLFLTMVSLGCGYGSHMASAPQPGVVPTVSQLVPNTANAGDPQFILTVNGSNFATDAVINWNGTKQTTTRMTAGQLTATIPASDIASPGKVPVSVTNPGTPGSGGIYGSGGTASETSNAMNFTVD